MRTLTGDMTPSQKRRFFLLILMLIMFAGVVAGTLMYIRDRESGLIKSWLLSQQLNEIMNETVLQAFRNAFLPVLVLLVFQFICGFFAFGQPFSVLTLFLRGVAGGIVSATTYSEYGFRGFFVIIIMLVPMLIFNMYILSLGARESLRLSNLTAGFIFGKNNDGVCEIRLYFIKFLVLAGFALASAVIESVIIYFLSGFVMKP